MNSSSLEALRIRLDPKPLEWLRANPGSLIIPRSVSEALLLASGQQEPLEGVDLHDHFLPSPLDRTLLGPWQPRTRLTTPYRRVCPGPPLRAERTALTVTDTCQGARRLRTPSDFAVQWVEGRCADGKHP
jgi:hypothetical protein